MSPESASIYVAPGALHSVDRVVAVISIYRLIMINEKRIAVVLPAYNAAKTLEKTVQQLPSSVDIKILVDDFSSDETVLTARRLGLITFTHQSNQGYGSNQKTCYQAAIDSGADVVIMVHPDYQYDPRLVTAIAGMIAHGIYEVVLGSRILGGGALKGGMPVYKYVANRMLTAVQNLLLGSKLSEFHTGLRGFSRNTLLSLPVLENSDDFVFDNQMLAQAILFGYSIGEVSCPTKYFEDASSIHFSKSVRYGIGVLWTSCQFVLQKSGLMRFRIFDADGRKISAMDVENALDLVCAKPE
jgi:glycosyltransferase involved in cell wall biosynthesis